MTETLPPKPFSRQMYAATDNLVGARWWQESLHRSAPDRISRRKALLTLALALGPAAGAALHFPNPSSVDIDGTSGWRDALSTLAADLAPGQVTLAPFYVPTLLQAP